MIILLKIDTRTLLHGNAHRGSYRFILLSCTISTNFDNAYSDKHVLKGWNRAETNSLKRVDTGKPAWSIDFTCRKMYESSPKTLSEFRFWQRCAFVHVHKDEKMRTVIAVTLWNDPWLKTSIMRGRIGNSPIPRICSARLARAQIQIQLIIHMRSRRAERDQRDQVLTTS